MYPPLPLPQLAQRLLWTILTLAVTAACGGHATTNPGSADATHQAWVQAVATKDKAAGEAVVVQGRGFQVSNAWGMIQRTTQRLDAPYALTRADAAQVTGTTATAISVWTILDTTVCYQTLLEQHGTDWKVANWTKTDCP